MTICWIATQNLAILSQWQKNSPLSTCKSREGKWIFLTMSLSMVATKNHINKNKLDKYNNHKKAQKTTTTPKS
ncbi:hypothetical protein [Helicobacter sp. T3_23-1059]